VISMQTVATNQGAMTVLARQGSMETGSAANVPFFLGLFSPIRILIPILISPNFDEHSACGCQGGAEFPLRCDSNGVCICESEFVGDKCDSCDVGRYGPNCFGLFSLEFLKERREEKTRGR